VNPVPIGTFRARVEIRSRATGAVVGHHWSLAVAAPTVAAAAPTFERWARLWAAVAPPGVRYEIAGIFPARPELRQRTEASTI